FAGIFQPFARLRWIRFGLFMQALNSGARLKPHRQRQRAHHSEQRAGPDDRTWRRTSRTKGPTDNKLCVTKAEPIWGGFDSQPLQTIANFSRRSHRCSLSASRRLQPPALVSARGKFSPKVTANLILL